MLSWPPRGDATADIGHLALLRSVAGGTSVLSLTPCIRVG